MTSPSPCPDSRLLQALLEGAVDATEEKSLRDHLCTCATCQAKLEFVASDGTEVIPNGYAGDSTVLTPALSAAIDRFRDGLSDDTSGNTIEEDFSEDQAALSCLLSPSSSPDVFGRLGQYEVSKVLGQGGMGVVFLGKDPDLQRPVAIKVLAPSLACNRAARTRFIREARAQAKVNHPNLVTIYEVSELTEEELPFLVMEYVPGEPLTNRLNRSTRLSVDEAVRIGSEIASGLSAAHGAGVIHRDIKPANILLDSNTQLARITDFGLALVHDAADDRITRTGTIAGTPGYMSPEQVSERDVDHRSDLFSLGTLLYVALTGENPFAADSNHEVLNRIVAAEATPIREHSVEVPDWLEQIINRLHQKNPDDRFQSATAVRDALLSPSDNPRGAVVTPAPNRTVAWVGAVAICVLLFGFLFARLTGDKPSVLTTIAKESSGTEPSANPDKSDALTTTPDSPLPRPFFVYRPVDLLRAMRLGERNIVIDTDQPLLVRNLRFPAGETRISVSNRVSGKIISDPDTPPGVPLFDVGPKGHLTIQDVEIAMPRRRGAVRSPGVGSIFRVDGGSLKLTRCSVSMTSGSAALDVVGNSVVCLNQTQLETARRTGIRWQPTASASIELTQCTHHGDTLCQIDLSTPRGNGTRFSVSQTNLDTVNTFTLIPDGQRSSGPPIELKATDCIFDSSAPLTRCLIRVARPMQFESINASRQWVLNHVTWTGHSNLFAIPETGKKAASFIRWFNSPGPPLARRLPNQPQRQMTNCWTPRSFFQWENFWRIAETRPSLMGAVDYQTSPPIHEDSGKSFGVDPARVGPATRH